jgi:hypothetical protein
VEGVLYRCVQVRAAHREARHAVRRHGLVSRVLLVSQLAAGCVYSEIWRFLLLFSPCIYVYIRRVSFSRLGCSLEYWVFEILVLIAGLLPDSTVSTSLTAMWYVPRPHLDP